MNTKELRQEMDRKQAAFYEQQERIIASRGKRWKRVKTKMLRADEKDKRISELEARIKELEQ